MNIQEKTVSHILANPNDTIDDTMAAVPCGKSVYYAAKSAIESVREIEADKDALNVVVAGDYHCGHKVGLTPPEWYANPFNADLRAKQEEMWEFYSRTLKSLGPIDILIGNGDLIDGSGKRSGGTELITTDRHEQAKIAIRCILEANAKKIYLTFGTPYHTGNSEDFETIVAEGVNAETIQDQLFLDVNGLTFDVKHATGSSTVPYGRGTAASKAKTWNREWAEVKNQPKADIFIRNHVHYYNYNGNKQYFSMTNHALQGPDTKFGGRKCEGTVSFGFMNFKIKKGDTISTMYKREYSKELETFRQELLVA